MEEGEESEDDDNDGGDDKDGKHGDVFGSTDILNDPEWYLERRGC